MEFVVSSQYGGGIEHGSQRVLRELSKYELDLKPIEVIEEESGFKIGGVNESDLIKGLKEINGQSIQSLEQRMRPNNDSMAGFLGENENLLDVLVDDNDFVLSQGLTHQDLVEPLQFAKKFAHKGFGDTFQYKGGNYKIDLTSWRGMQFSPFEDRTGTDSDATITNLDNGEQLSLSLLIPDMAERYGFYEGKETSYRLEPS